MKANEFEVGKVYTCEGRIYGEKFIILFEVKEILIEKYIDIDILNSSNEFFHIGKYTLVPIYVPDDMIIENSKELK